jgi:hypothetical protein
MSDELEKQLLKVSADVDKRVSVLEAEMYHNRNRLEKIDAHIGGIFERLNDMAHSLDKHMTEEARDRSKLMVGVVITLLTVLGTFLLERIFK